MRHYLLACESGTRARFFVVVSGVGLACTRGELLHELCRKGDVNPLHVVAVKVINGPDAKHQAVCLGVDWNKGEWHV